VSPSTASSGQVCVTDCSKPLEEQVRYRPLTKKEQAQRKRDHADALVHRRQVAYVSLRFTRDRLLQITDHLDADPRWSRWRQKLRDLPQTADPEKVRWPKPPAAASCLADYREFWPRLDWSLLTQGSR